MTNDVALSAGTHVTRWQEILSRSVPHTHRIEFYIDEEVFRAAACSRELERFGTASTRSR